MFKFSKKELDDFRLHGKKIIREKSFKEGFNPAMNWHQYKNPLKQAKNYFIVLVCGVLPPCEIKNSLFRLMGCRIGKNVSIANGGILDPIFPELIKIEDNVLIGWGTKLFTHEFTPNSVRIGTVLVKKGSMVGEFSVVRPGVIIGKNSMIAAMSFVNEDVEDDMWEGGVPIHVIKHHQKMMRRRKSL